MYFTTLKAWKRYRVKFEDYTIQLNRVARVAQTIKYEIKRCFLLMFSQRLRNVYIFK